MDCDLSPKEFYEAQVQAVRELRHDKECQKLWDEDYPCSVCGFTPERLREDYVYRFKNS